MTQRNMTARVQSNSRLMSDAEDEPNMPEQSVSDTSELGYAVDALVELSVEVVRASSRIETSIDRLAEAVEQLNRTMQAQWPPTDLDVPY